MDVDGLVAMLRRLEAGAIRVHFVESTEPSVLSHEILNGKPYTFLDDAPLEERRTRAVQMRRGLPAPGRGPGRARPRRRRAGSAHEAAPDIRGSRGASRSAALARRPATGGRTTAPGSTPWPGDGPGHRRDPPPVTRRRSRRWPTILWSRRGASAVGRGPLPRRHLPPRPPAPGPAPGHGPVDADVAAADALRGHLEVTRSRHRGRAGRRGRR